MRSKAKVQAALAETTFAGLGESGGAAGRSPSAAGAQQSCILNQSRLANNSTLTPSTSQAQPYRCFPTSDDSDRHGCKRKLPIAQAERPVCSRTCREVDAEEAVKRGESVLLTGAPGTG